MDINKEIFNLWGKANLDKRIPLVYPNAKDMNCEIVFVGLNPSFSERGFNKILRGKGYDHVLDNKGTYYAFANARSAYDKVGELIAIEEHALREHNYQTKFKEISDEVKKLLAYTINTRHIDLLFIRQTKQKEIVNAKKSIPGYDKFLCDQMEISVKFMMAHNPKLIIICNAYAGRLFQEKFKEHLAEMPDIGADQFTYTGSKSIVLYSGMLSGQHALDIGSLNRLKWDIKFILKYMSRV